MAQTDRSSLLPMEHGIREGLLIHAERLRLLLGVAAGFLFVIALYLGLVFLGRATGPVGLISLAVTLVGYLASRGWGRSKTVWELRRFPVVFRRPGRTRALYTREESYRHLLRATVKARSSIDIVSYVELRAADTKRRRFYESLRAAALERHVNEQRIIWNADHVRWLLEEFEHGLDSAAEFSVKFYHGAPPTFMVVDQEIVTFAHDWLGSGHIVVGEPEVAKYFRAYFAVLWEESEWIKKRGQPANRNRLTELLVTLGEVPGSLPVNTTSISEADVDNILQEYEEEF